MNQPQSARVPAVPPRPPGMLPPPQPSKEDMMIRLARVREALVAGWPRREIVEMCRMIFFVCPRTAYRYIRRAERQMAGRQDKETPAYGRQLAQDRRNFLFYQLGRALDGLNPRDMRHLPHLTALAAVAARLVDHQERSADKRAKDAPPAPPSRGPALQVTAQQSTRGLVSGGVVKGVAVLMHAEPVRGVADSQALAAVSPQGLVAPESLSAKLLLQNPADGQPVTSVSNVSQPVTLASGQA